MQYNDKDILAIIREYCKETKLYNKAHKKGLGAEATEEILIKLIKNGELEIVEDKGKYFII